MRSIPARIWAGPAATIAILLWLAGRAQAANPDTMVVVSDSLRLHALFYHPAGRGPFPGLLFNHGGGHRSGVGADGTLDQRRPELLGRLFARHGYAFLYLYRRGDGLSRDRGPAVGDVMDSAMATGGLAARNTIQLERLEHEEMDDATAGLAALRARPQVDPRRVGVIGHSFGGSLATLMVARDTSLRAAVVFSGAGFSWDRSPDLRQRLMSAVARTPVPMLFIHAANDYTTAPGESLSAVMRRLGKVGRVRVYPAVGRSAADGHNFIHSGAHLWERDVLAFLDPLLKR
jgi:dienelactone hydrolase